MTLTARQRRTVVTAVIVSSAISVAASAAVVVQQNRLNDLTHCVQDATAQNAKVLKKDNAGWAALDQIINPTEGREVNFDQLTKAIHDRRELAKDLDTSGKCES